jgi:hypothetical protein
MRRYMKSGGYYDRYSSYVRAPRRPVYKKKRRRAKKQDGLFGLGILGIL